MHWKIIRIQIIIGAEQRCAPRAGETCGTDKIRFCAWQHCCSCAQATVRRSFVPSSRHQFISNFNKIIIHGIILSRKFTTHLTGNNFFFFKSINLIFYFACYERDCFVLVFVVGAFTRSIRLKNAVCTLSKCFILWHPNDNTSCVTSWLLWTCRRASHQFSYVFRLKYSYFVLVFISVIFHAVRCHIFVVANDLWDLRCSLLLAFTKIRCVPELTSN